jgi:transposase
MNKIKTNFEGQAIYVGMDVHKDSWNLGLHLNDIFLKKVHQKPNPQIMVDYLHKTLLSYYQRNAIQFRIA